MTYEVVVVGAGVGGLTAAALLAARGVSVCVVERESRAGGCAAGFEKMGYSFETTGGLYSGWGAGGAHSRVFAELPVAPPAATLLSTPYVVRLGDGTDVRTGGGAEEFEATLSAAFPECAAAAADFSRGLAPLADASGRAAAGGAGRARPSAFGRLAGLVRRGRGGEVGPASAADAAAVSARLPATSPRFRSFVDAQLLAFAQVTSERCPVETAARVLTLPQRGLYTLAGGARSLADALADSIRQSGGTLRFDTTALRLACDAEGRAAGVDLLSGETVRASRAVVSNLTVWDTYGKLVGLSRAPAEIRALLKSLRGRSAYLLFLAMSEEAAARLPAPNLLAVADSGRPAESGGESEETPAELSFAATPAGDARAPAGERAVTVSTFADPEDWFTYHEDETEHEARDQRTLEAVWARLHAALPELGDSCEVVETLTPRGYYEWTRRGLGRVGAAWQAGGSPARNNFTHRTAVPRLFAAGDTLAHGSGIEAVTRAALAAADEIAPPRR